MATKKKAKSKRSKATFKIVCKNGVWKPIGKDNKEGKPITGPMPPLGPPEVIIVQHIVGPPTMSVPPHQHKGKAGRSNPPYNTHCHKTVYIGGVPYLVHC